jgi:hypothetical protein
MSGLGDQILSKISDSKDLLTKIGSKIPGFSGYIDRQERRNSDKLLRDTIAKRVMDQHKRVSELQVEMIGEGGIEHLDDMEKAAIRLQTFADRVRTATRGYSSVFEAVKIDEDALNKILAYDNTLLDKTEQIAAAVDTVQSSLGSDGLKAAIRNLQTVSQDCIDAFNLRDEVVLSQ